MVARRLLKTVVACALCGALMPVSVGIAQDVTAEARAAERQKLYEESQKQISLRVLDRLGAAADAVQRDLATLVQSHEQLKQRILGIQSNDEGKKLASQLESIDSDELAYHIDRLESISEDELALNERNLIRVRKQLEEERRKVVPGYLPPETLQSEIDAIRVWVGASAKVIDARNNWFDMKLLAVPRDFDLSAAPTFRVRWSEVKHTRAKELAEARERAVQQAREEGKAKAGAQAGELERARIDLELQQIREQFAKQMEDQASKHRESMKAVEQEMKERLERQQLEFEKREAALANELKVARADQMKQDEQAEAKRAQIEIEAEKVRLRQKVNDPKVKGVLAPFTTPGFYQPGQRLPDGQKRPVSLAALQGAGMLGSDKDSMRRLVLFLRNKDDTDRPRWAISDQSARWKPADIAMIQEAQSLLLELGPTMVEMGLLQP